MAAPIKNYTDPTFLSKVAPSFPSAALPPIEVSLGLPTANWLWPTNQAFRIPLIVRGMSTPRPNMPYQSSIPTPPMGRITILTFPSIYKERGGTGVSTGQIYPPKAK